MPRILCSQERLGWTYSKGGGQGALMLKSIWRMAQFWMPACWWSSSSKACRQVPWLPLIITWQPLFRTRSSSKTASGGSNNPSNGSKKPSLEFAHDMEPTTDWLHEVDLWISFLDAILERLIIRLIIGT